MQHMDIIAFFFRLKRDKNCDACYNMDGPGRHYTR